MPRISNKLIRILLLCAGLPLLMLTGLTLIFIERMAQRDARQRIETELDIGFNIYQQSGEHLKYTVRDINRRISTLLELGSRRELRSELEGFAQTHRLDFFVLTDPAGRVLISLPRAGLEGADLRGDLHVRSAAQARISLGTERLDAATLYRWGLDGPARIQGLQPPQGLVLRATLPVINRREQVVGTMSAGYLLNNRTDLLEEIRRATGMVSSIFLDKVRISTTVPDPEDCGIKGSVFRGTQQYSGMPTGYFGRLKLSGQWYLTGYRGLQGMGGEQTAVLGIGLPIKLADLFSLRHQLLNAFLLAMPPSVGLAVWLGLLLGRDIGAAVRSLHEGIEAFAHGDLFRRIQIHTHDELEDLGTFYNHSMQQLQETGRQNSQLGVLLEAYKRINTTLTQQELAECLVNFTERLVQARKISVMFMDKTGERLIIQACLGLEPEATSEVITLENSIAGRVARGGEAVVVDDMTKFSPMRELAHPERYQKLAFVSLPLKVTQRTVGLLNAADKRGDIAVFNGEDVHYLQLLVGQAVSQLANIQLYERLAQHAVTDALTGLFNHRYFHEQLNREVIRCQRYDQPLSLLMCDVDNFKMYNDIYGHLQGDEVLRVVAQTMKDSLRQADIICRYAGDEFALILTNTDTVQGTQAAGKMIAAVARIELLNPETTTPLRISLSCGLSEYKPGMTKDQLLSYADQALYQSKAGGKNRVSVFQLKEQNFA